MAGVIEFDEDNARTALISAVVAIVEILHEVLKRQATRRLREQSLTDEELDRVGKALLSVEQALDDLKKDLGLTDAVARTRSDLDSLVEQLLTSLPSGGENA